MPVTIIRDPFDGNQHERAPATPKEPRQPRPPRQPRKKSRVSTLQARVLAPLLPPRIDSPAFDWPTWTRALLAEHAGYTALSGSVTRALNGIRPGSSSDGRKLKDGTRVPGKGHPGLLALGFVEAIDFDIDGKIETNYRATRAGFEAYQEYLALRAADLQKHRDKASSLNNRYKKKVQENSEGGLAPTEGG